MATQPWTGGLVTFVFHNDGTIGLKKADGNVKPEACFDPSQPSELEAIFAEILHIGRAPRGNSLWMRSAEKDSSDRFIGVVGEIVGEYEKDGAKINYSHAYSIEQVQAFKPVSFVMKARWTGRALVPVLHAYATKSEHAATAKFTRSVSAAKPAGEARAATTAKPAGQPEYRRTKTA